MYYGPPRMAPDRPRSNLCWSGVVRGCPGVFFFLRQPKFVDDSSSSRQRYELLRHHHGIITDGAGATTKTTTVLLLIVTDCHGSTTDRPGSAIYHPGRVTDRVRDLWALPDNHGLSRIMPLPLRMMPVSLRCHHGRCRHRPKPTMARPGSWPRPGSSRTVPDFLNSLKFQKRPPEPSRTFQDHPGPFQDHPKAPRTITAALRMRDGSSHGSYPGQSVAVRELGVTVA